VLWSSPEGGYCALNPETGTTSQGESQADALRNLQEATSLFLEEFPLSPGERQAGVDVSSFIQALDG
jgi:predicted RNase H-like HicB family nuclease